MRENLKRPAMRILELTERAAKRLSELKQAGAGRVLRLSVKQAGCGGNGYDLSYADAPGPRDEKVEAHGAELYVDPLSLVFVIGTEVDWVEDRMQRRFEFRNPNETSRCGCGESFSVA